MVDAINGRTEPQPWPPITVALAARKSLDLSGLASHFGESPRFGLLFAHEDLEKFVVDCHEGRPSVAVIDAAYGEGRAFRAAADLISSGCVQVAAMLDDNFAAYRELQTKAVSGAGYFTRFDSFRELCRGIIELLKQARQREVPNGRAHRKSIPKDLGAQNREDSQHNLNDQRFLSLSPKELQVMSVLARGHTVGEAARILNLCPSTVDNHKSRIMKKLEICHMTQITRVAMRVGLID